MIAVTADQVPRALIALRDRAEGPIFLQSNLHNYGLATDSQDRRALHLWRNADWTAFAGLTAGGVLMPQMRDASPDDWRDLRQVLAGCQISGLNGTMTQISRALDVLSLTEAPTNLDREEPCFNLSLADMTMPDVTGFVCKPLQDADRALLHDWRIAYRVEIMGDSVNTAAEDAGREIDEWFRDNSHRLLWQGAQPVALAGINARLPSLVQIGGVYTPPPLRGRGLARRAVAMLLAELRQTQDMTRAYLFAASERAARAYTAIGFKPAGQMRLVIFSSPVRVLP